VRRTKKKVKKIYHKRG